MVSFLERVYQIAFIGFIAALLSHSRPIHEMLQPNFQDQRTAFEAQFAGMTEGAFSYSDFETTRAHLVTEINCLLTDDDKIFLVSFKAGEPQWGLYPIVSLQNMSAVQWKFLNINKLLNKSPDKHGEQLELLRKSLGVAR